MEAFHTALSDPEGACRIDEVLARLDRTDRTLYDVGRSVLAVLREPKTAETFLSSDIASALYARLVQRYGHMPPPPTRAGRCLAAWQERLAKSMLTADLAEDASLEAVADACGLALNRFVQAFGTRPG